MSTPSLRAPIVSIAGNGSAFNNTIPASTQAGDLLLAFIVTDGSPSITRPSGWSLVASSSDIYAYSKVAVAGDAGTAASFSFSPACNVIYFLAVYKGVPASGQIDAFRTDVGTYQSVTTGSLTTTHDGDLLVEFGAMYAATGSPTVSGPATSEANRAYSHNCGAISDQALGAAGATTGKTFTFANGSGGQSGSITLALTPGNTPPNAPALGLPDGTVLDRNATNRLPWTFSDPDPSDSQSAANLRYRLTGTTPWTTVNVPNPNNFWDAVAGTFAAGDYEWQVQTADSSGIYGPYSGSGFFTVADAPNPPTWLDPISGQTIGSASYTGVISAPNVDESEWTLYADNAGAIGTAVLQGPVSVTTGDVRSHTFAGLANNVPVWWSVRVKYQGLWSQPTQIRTPVSYSPPPAPQVTLTPDVANGALVVGITNPAPGAGEPATSYNNVYVDDGKGKGKERVATMLPTNTPWTYPWPVSLRDYTGNLWVEAVATNGTTAETTA